jgi:D-alanyl-D-alanine carboxypeptidase
MSLADATIRSAEGHTLTLSHTHELLHEPSEVIAGKTGTTDNAGQCLLSVVKDGGREYLVVLLGSHERYIDMKALLRSLNTLSS